MSQDSKSNQTKPDIMLSARDFFSDMIESALESRNMEARPMTRVYLTDLLEHYLVTENLFESPDERGRTETMAERLLKAVNSDSATRPEQLKKLGDTTLYVSGFFGDSFKRKIIDIDYYVDIGGCAYGSLANQESDSMYGVVFEDLALRFVDYVDVLTFISHKSFIQNNEDLLRLYDRYIMTGSKLAEEHLAENGMLNSSNRKAK